MKVVLKNEISTKYFGILLWYLREWIISEVFERRVMGQEFDKLNFFYEATRRILGDFRIEKAMQSCLLYMRDYIPADYFSLHLFDPGLGVVETVVDATEQESELKGQKTSLTPEARELMHLIAGRKKPGYSLFDRLSDDEMTRQLGLDLKTPDASCLSMDLMIMGKLLGIVALTNVSGRPYTKEQGRLLLTIHDPLAMSCAQYKRFREIERLKDVIADDARRLQDDLMHQVGDEVIGADYGLKEVMDRVSQVSFLNTPVLLLGETGVGKEIIAGAIHRWSPRRKGPFIKVNCGSIPASLMESEIFGHEKGAFTGALSRRRGYFERAHGGTILLDEIGELPMAAQTRLLRVLQEKTVERIGGSSTIEVDTRVVAATNRDIEDMLDKGGFRRDLYFRLNVFPIQIPPLRNRRLDIPGLVHHFLAKKSREMSLPDRPRVEPGAVDRLMDYDWPGNVRELENIIEREVIIRRGGALTFADFRPGAREAQACPNSAEEGESLAYDAVVSRHIVRVLKMTKGKVEGVGGAADILNVNPRTLQYRMKNLGIPFGRKAKGQYD